MLSIDAVKNVSFRKANLSGYRAEDVDSFIDEVVATLEQNKRDKVDLVKKLDILAKRIEEYRKDEESVRGALINAERLKEDAQKESKQKAEKIIADAQAQAKQIIYDAKASVVDEKNNYLKLQADAVVLRENLLETYNNHIQMLNDLPSSTDISKKKMELDKKYPTKDMPKKEEAKKQEKEEVVDISGTSEFSKAKVTEEAAEGRFNNLEFGEDYQADKK